VKAGEPLLWVHARTEADLTAAVSRLARALLISPDEVTAPPLVHRVIR
jgi:thymidine phosphorylase